MEQVMRSIQKILIIFLFLLPVILPGCKSDNEEAEETRVPVRVYEVKPASLTEYLKIPGTISAGEDAVVFSKVSERVERILVRAGDKVNVNQTLTVQSNEILNQGLEAAKASVNSAEVQFELLTQDLERMERLYKQRAISQQQYDQLVTQRKSAEANLEALKAQYRQAEEQVQNSILKAPFSGIVAAVFVEVNQMVPAGQPVVQVINPSTWKAKAKISGRNIDLVKKGQEVLVTVPSIPDKNYKGKISLINRAVDPVSKNLEIEITITNADDRIKSGMHGNFHIAANEIKDALIIPENALLTQTEIAINRETGIQESVKKYFVFTVDEETANLKEISVGLITEGRAEVRNGLSVSDKVIIVGNNVVQDGDKVNIIE
jgi:membrane fusion protein, multidrug efflux system